MINFIFPIVMLFILIGITIGLFLKLKIATAYNVMIYIGLFFFWISQAVISNEAADSYEASWKWPILVGMYQLTQVFTRIPFGLLSRKLKSRKIPILISSVVLLIGLFINVACFDSEWAKYIAMFGAGVFGGSFGMQNTNWSENNNLKDIFMTVAIMGMLPTLGDYTAKTLIKSSYFNDYNATRWILMASGIVSAVALIIYIFSIRERKETIKLDDLSGKNATVASLNTKAVIFNCIGTFLAAVSFEAIKATAINKYAVIGSSLDPNDATIISLVVSAVTAIVTVLVSLIFIRKIKSYVLTMIAQSIMVLSLVFGLSIVATHSIGLVTWIIFIFFSSIGYAMFMTTMFGVMMHFDHRNRLLVLGIWLTIRSFGMFAGQITSNELVIAFAGPDNLNIITWIFTSCLIISIGSLIFSVVRYKFGEKEVFTLVDRLEYDYYHTIEAKLK